MSAWKKWEDDKPFRVGRYDDREGRTLVTCKECGQEYPIPGHLCAEKKAQGGKEWSTLNNVANTYAKRHTCTPIVDELPVLDEEAASILSKPMKEWTADLLTDYLTHCSDRAPELFAVEEYTPGVHGQKAPFCVCIFRHPVTGLLSPPLWIHATLIFHVYENTAPQMIKKLDDMKRSRKIRDVCEEVVEDLIYTVMKQEEHRKEPGFRTIMRPGLGPSSCRRGIQIARRDSKHVYKSLMVLFRRCPASPIELSGTVLDNLLDATFYGEPRVDKMEDWCWVDGNHFTTCAGTKVSLLYKPHALHSWLLLAKQRIANAPTVRLVVDGRDTHSVVNDTYGYTGRALPLHFKENGTNGVVCAVLCFGDSDEPTIVRDRNVVLPIGLLTTS